jgi:hypothetical protein
VRVNSLRSGLESVVDGSKARAAGPSSWFSTASDPSEKAAVSYRVGMAAAHWVTVSMLGLADTRHVSQLPAGDPRRTAGKQPDLYGQHSSGHPVEWLIEAKGGERVTSRRRQDGRDQLQAVAGAGVWATDHVQALVSASMSPMLHMVVELGVPAAVSMPAGWADPTTWPVSRPTLGAATRFRRRVLIGAALLAAEVPVVRLMGSLDVRLLEIPESGVRVGLLESAYREVTNQLARLAQIDPEGRLGEDRVHAVLIDQPPTDADWSEAVLQALLGLHPDEATGVALLDETTGDDAVIAVDDAGIVVELDDSWSIRPYDG